MECTIVYYLELEAEETVTAAMFIWKERKRQLPATNKVQTDVVLSFVYDDKSTNDLTSVSFFFEKDRTYITIALESFINVQGKKKSKELINLVSC